MALVTCSDLVQNTLALLTEEVRDGINLRLDYLADHPRMYPLTEDERFPGCRSFWVEPCYRVFYMVAAGGDDVHVTVLIEEEVDGPGEG